MRVFIIENNAAPYRDDTFLEMKKKTGWDIRILTERRPGVNDNHAEWQYQSPLEAFRIYSSGVWKISFLSYRKGAIRTVLGYHPDAILTGSLLEGALFKILFRKRVVLMSDTMKKGKNAAKRWNKVLLTFLYKCGDAVWVPGRAAETYYKKYLGDSRKIYQGAYTNDALRQKKNIHRWKEQRDSLRKAMEVESDQKLFLFVGKLIKTRNVEILLRAAESLEEKTNKIKFLVIGNGSDSEKVKEYCSKHKNLCHIEQVPLRELEKYYAIADAYVHPGEEPYSLALYEAATAGLPIVASEKVGAVQDCLQDGKNGYLFLFGSSTDLAQKIVLVAEEKLNPQEIVHMADFIEMERGTRWSSEELSKALMGSCAD